MLEHFDTQSDGVPTGNLIRADSASSATMSLPKGKARAVAPTISPTYGLGMSCEASSHTSPAWLWPENQISHGIPTARDRSYTLSSVTSTSISSDSPSNGDLPGASPLFDSSWRERQTSIDTAASSFVSTPASSYTSPSSGMSDKVWGKQRRRTLSGLSTMMTMLDALDALEEHPAASPAVTQSSSDLPLDFARRSIEQSQSEGSSGLQQLRASLEEFETSPLSADQPADPFSHARANLSQESVTSRRSKTSLAHKVLKKIKSKSLRSSSKSASTGLSLPPRPGSSSSSASSMASVPISRFDLVISSAHSSTLSLDSSDVPVQRRRLDRALNWPGIAGSTRSNSVASRTQSTSSPEPSTRTTTATADSYERIKRPAFQRALTSVRFSSHASRVSSPLASPSLSRRQSRSNSPSPSRQIDNATRHIAQSGRSRSASSPVLSTYARTHIQAPNPNLFDLLLPREIKLLIFGSLVATVADERHLPRKHRWHGHAGAMRQLVLLSRVSRSWMDIAFDGQLWQSLDFASIGSENINEQGVVRIAAHCGSFARSADLSGFANLSAHAMRQICDACLTTSPSGLVQNQLTSINLTGCHTISTLCLHYLLARSPELDTLKMPGLASVVNSTLEILAGTVRALRHLDVGRCPNLEASALLRLARPELSAPLTVLKASRLRLMNDHVFGRLSSLFPLLEVLDVSRSRALTDSGIAAFVKADDDSPFDKAQVTAKLLGRQNLATMGWRRRTALRSLSLSHCSSLTAVSLAHLILAVPELQILELAGLHRAITDDALIPLLSTLPQLRKLDLEDAAEISPAVLHALTPSTKMRTREGAGRLLEHLVLSSAVNMSDEATLNLISRCLHLRIIELDNCPGISDVSLRKFVETMRARGTRASEINVTDCRAITRDALPPAMLGSVRPRRGQADSWRYDALHYGEPAASLTDELDDRRVIVHSFWQWAMLDDRQRDRDETDRAQEPL
ncbi:hypothetical protein E5Q_00273 [Mixia osmundae IAM 14324]|uniref:F-box domain-containing protein n=1 Tax=Mixia osmundae (strain CBS 9802 / IAM 14324 / JCM 22182 / KY 12970) TaxID=764103 RepID=G7DSS1_MIXOS|nr:hypothetical protein E5Q_00273 [Mixia osmundae IAM 14324]